MSNINILHLSDLHISGKRLSATSRKLIEDIAIQTKTMEKIILVVSGDMVDKGEYSKSKDGVLLFFKTLKETLSVKIIGAIFVPGNHDKVRNISNNLYSELSQIKDLKITEDIWQLQSENYKSFLELVYEIKTILKVKKSKLAKTFGVDYFDIDGEIICFIQIDTSWGTYGGKDEEGKLVVGEFQLNSLHEQYDNTKELIEEKGKQIALTIGVGHHPTSWLSREQEKRLKKYMIDEEYFNMDLYLCGHIHDMELENWYNSEHSLMTLVTGIGWDHRVENSNEKDRKDQHRYSIYILDVSKNSCDIIMRRSQQNGKFISDYSVYVEDEKNPGRLRYPLKIKNGNQPFINMNSPSGDQVKSMFVGGDLMNVIKIIHYAMLVFRKKSVELLQYYKRDYVERQADIYKKSEEYDKVKEVLTHRFFLDDPNDKQAKEIFENSINIVYEVFIAFLQELLSYFVVNFVDCFPNNSNLRVHFRWYNKEDDEYLKLCQYSNIDLEAGPSVSKIPWGGLIEQSYMINNSVIYSINPQYNKHTPVKWNDFMTIVPSFLNSEQEFRGKNKKKIKRPSMTFGISILNEKCAKEELSQILYVLEYLDVYQMISDVLDDFINDFMVDYSGFLTYIEEQRRNII